MGVVRVVGSEGYAEGGEVADYLGVGGVGLGVEVGG